MLKREIIISINDNCKEPFNDTDFQHIKNGMADILSDYDVEVTKVEVRNKMRDLDDEDSVFYKNIKNRDDV
jgi:hypothetical protein